MQEIIPPAKIDSSSVKLSAEANWLVCEKICIPGSATCSSKLPTSTTVLRQTSKCSRVSAFAAARFARH